jgi:ketosteroid isomerase-like protein
MESDEAVVRNAFEALAEAAQRSTPEARTELTERWFHPDVEYSEDPSWPGSSSYRGRDAVRGAFESYMEILGVEVTVEEVSSGTQGLFASVRYRGSSTGAGMPFDQTWGYHCLVRDGQVAYFRAYSEVGEALSAAGVDSP